MCVPTCMCVCPSHQFFNLNQTHESKFHAKIRCCLQFFPLLSTLSLSPWLQVFLWGLCALVLVDVLISRGVSGGCCHVRTLQRAQLPRVQCHLKGGERGCSVHVTSKSTYLGVYRSLTLACTVVLPWRVL